MVGKAIKNQKKLFEPYLYNMVLINWAQPKLKEVFHKLFLTEQVSAMIERDNMLKRLLVKELE